MSLRYALARTGGFIALVAAVGCSGTELGQFANVSGTVTHNGNPVDGAKVMFQGTTEGEGGAKDTFSAYTDSSGKYMISGVGKNPGIPPGLYKVAITKYVGKGMQQGEMYDPGQIDAMISDGGGAAVASLKNHLPQMYASPESSKLSATIQSGKNEGVNFELKSK